MYAGELSLVLKSDQSAAGNLTPGRIMAGNKQVRDHIDSLCVGQAFTVRLGGKQRGDEIASRVVSASCRQAVDIGLQLGDRLRRVRDLFGRHDEEHRAQCIGPLPEDLSTSASGTPSKRQIKRVANDENATTRSPPCCTELTASVAMSAA